MKKGFFALLLMVLLINPVFSSDLKVGESKLDIKVTTDNMPSVDGHELEEFWDRIQNACEDPDEAGNQLPPENVMVQCLRRTSLWAQTFQAATFDLPNECEIDAWIYCDKDIGNMHGNFPQSLCPDHGASIDPQPGQQGANDLQPPEKIDNILCASYAAYIYWEFSQQQGLTCEDIEGVESIEEYCANMLDNDPDVWTADAGEVVEFCETNVDPIVELPVQPLPPEIPGSVDCNNVDWPNEIMPDQCCNGAIQPVAPVCEKVCNAYTPGNQPKYCCDGTVPGSGVSTPEDPAIPAICEIKPPKPPTTPPTEPEPVPPPPTEPTPPKPPVDCSVPGAGEPGQCTSLCEKFPDPNKLPVFCCDGTVAPRPNNCSVEPPTDPKPPEAYPKECQKFDPHNQAIADLCCGTDWGVDSPIDCQTTCNDTIVPAVYCCDGTVTPEPKVCTGWFEAENRLNDTLKVLGVKL